MNKHNSAAKKTHQNSTAQGAPSSSSAGSPNVAATTLTNAKGASNHSLRVLTSSNDMTWETPPDVFGGLNCEFRFTLDPCCVDKTAKCKQYFTPEDDGLAQSWAGQRVFMNPPYGRDIGKWMEKAFHESRDNDALVVCLVPSRTDTEWWHRYATRAADIRYYKGRVTFVGAESPAPFPVAVVVFRPGSKK